MQDVEVKTMAALSFYIKEDAEERRQWWSVRNWQGERGGVHTDSGGPLRVDAVINGNRRFFEK